MWKVLKVLFLQNCRAKRGRQSAWAALHLQCSWVSQSARQPYLDNEAQGLPGISANRNLVQTSIAKTAFGFTECHTEQSQSELWSVTVYASLSASTLKQRRVKCPVHFLPDKYALRFFRGVPEMLCQEPEVFLVQISPAHLCRVFGIIGNRWFPWCWEVWRLSCKV